MSDAGLVETFREFERELSEPPFLGIPLGGALSEPLHRYLFIYSAAGGHRPPAFGARVDRVRQARHWALPRQAGSGLASVPPGRILVTWFASTPRYNDLIGPILRRLDEGSFAVIHDRPEVPAQLVTGVPHVQWDRMVDYDIKTWRAEYSRCRPQWQARVEDLCDRHRPVAGTREFLSLSIMVASQRVLGALRFLERTRPVAVLTEYDRNHLWSCLVLAARRLGIPTATLVHGVMDKDALAFSPVLADYVLCWGEMDKAKLRGAGEPEGKIVIAGCPRLTRELSATRERSRAKLGLDSEAPVVMYVSTPEPQSPDLVEFFCAGIGRIQRVVGMVRLHPSERLETFASSARRHPSIRFSASLESTVDEALAAVDLVVTAGSGMGSDALVKGRPVVVLNPGTVYRGADLDLVERGGCLHARTPEELGDVIGRTLSDAELRAEQAKAADRYATDFCAAYGDDSADRIASFVKHIASRA